MILDASNAFRTSFLAKIDFNKNFCLSVNFVIISISHKLFKQIFFRFKQTCQVKTE